MIKVWDFEVFTLLLMIWLVVCAVVTVTWSWPALVRYVKDTAVLVREREPQGRVIHFTVVLPLKRPYDWEVDG